MSQTLLNRKLYEINTVLSHYLITYQGEHLLFLNKYNPKICAQNDIKIFFQPEKMHAIMITIAEAVVHGFLLKSFTVFSCQFPTIFQKSFF